MKKQIQQEQYTGKGGIYSTRKLELACRKNIDFIWLLQGEKVPDYSSFARFRSGKVKEDVFQAELYLGKQVHHVTRILY